jgi:MoaA/NifB/PqqE/SkfB family radical SAM enzyme
MSLIATLTKNLKPFARNHIPGQVVIQSTNRCNALCPQCGMRRSAEFERTSIEDDTIKQILDACAAKGVQVISFTGGEPFLMLDNLIDWINYAGRLNIPFIRTGTNGFLFCGSYRHGFTDRIKRLADRLAATPLRNLWISLDSHIPKVHERMRGLPGVVAGIEKALPIFHAAGLYPSANLGINRFLGGEKTSKLHSKDFIKRDSYLNEFYYIYKESFDAFYCFIENLGFSIVNTCYPMSISDNEQKKGLAAVYAATAVEDVVRFSFDEKAMLYKALMDIIPVHRNRLRIFTPLCSVYRLYQSYSDGNKTENAAGCRGGVDFFFIDAVKGDTFPCGYRGNENLGKLWKLDLGALSDKQCRKCDWECFRDPSELCAPILEFARSPAKMFSKMATDPIYRRLWFEDLKYYHYCKFFNGRRPGNHDRFSHFPHSSSKTITTLTPA